METQNIQIQIELQKRPTEVVFILRLSIMSFLAQNITMLENILELGISAIIHLRMFEAESLMQIC